MDFDAWRAGDQRYYVSDTRRFRSGDRLGGRRRRCPAGLEPCYTLAAGRAAVGAVFSSPRGTVASMKIALVNPPGPSRAASTSAAASRTCRSSSATRERCSRRTATRCCCSTATRWAGRSPAMQRRAGATSGPTMTVVTTAPSYLFWRCAPPELRVPQQTIEALRETPAALVAVGPHGSTTPRPRSASWASMSRSWASAEEMLRQWPTPRADWPQLPHVAWREANGRVQTRGGIAQCDMAALPALRWAERLSQRHAHHHHRFDAAPAGPGAEMETSRGCPYHCTFCAKENFRDAYRKRPLDVILEELDGLIAQGVEYVYFIDEIFLPNSELLEALVAAAGEASACRRASTCGIATCSICWARPAACRSRPASRASPKKAAPARQAVPTDDGRDLVERLIHAQAARAVRAGQPDRRAGRRHATRWKRGGSTCCSTASGPTSRCRCSRIRARPTTPGAGARPTSRPGSARMRTTWPATSSSATSRSSVRVPLGELELPAHAGVTRHAAAS